MIYEFYYHGGDTSGYYAEANRVYEIFGNNFSEGWQLMTTSVGDTSAATLKYGGRFTWFTHAPTEDYVVRLCVVLALLSFSTYSVMALMFAAMSFSGMWVMYMTFIKIRPQLYKQFATAVLFIPSVFFWGSGVMKDSLCIGALGWVFYCFYRGAIEKKNILRSTIIGFLAATPIIATKVYILLAFLPPALLWVFNENSARISNKGLRMVAKPFLLAIGGGLAFFAATNLTAGDARFDVEEIGERSKITADYLYATSIAQEGSAYNIGQLDGSIGSMVKISPQAIVVTLFRPFLWEARNPIMLLSALEALFYLFFTARVLYRTGVAKSFGIIGTTPILTLCFVFSLIFAASVGISSSNFGTLVRYKIPLLPFYMCGLLITEDIGRLVRARRPA
ncbi:hypothetical protein GCM10022407_08720 [Hymenobacter antarcticus]|uniref:Glycosyltransferase RgtA/B/C/D-like domain-containing protein n=1 Tax=Hymenobacter antarcticus TaxID=486270 RepID=A0ABP7PEN8_9BACT